MTTLNPNATMVDNFTASDSPKQKQQNQPPRAPQRGSPGGGGDGGLSPREKRRSVWAVEQVQETRSQKLGKKLVYILDLPVVQILLMICLFLALFLVDSVQLATSTYDEAAMDAVLVIIMVLFTVEVGINATCRPNYGKVMLVIDLVGTLSMLIDLSPFANQLGAGSAMRAARVGSRAGRLTRLLRVVRLVRVFKILRSSRACGPAGRTCRRSSPPRESEISCPRASRCRSRSS